MLAVVSRKGFIWPLSYIGVHPPRIAMSGVVNLPFERWQAPSRRQSLVAQLVRQAAKTSGDQAFDLADIPAREFRWVLDGGLGPLLWHAIRATNSAIPEDWQAELRGADLTARIRHGDLVNTACDVIDAGSATNVPVTLLKGISVSEQLYPAEHLRPMGDIDVLVPRDGYVRVEADLLSGAYRRIDYPEMEGRHHGAPLRHRERNTLVELHVELFPDDSPLRRSGRVLSAAAVAANGVVSGCYHGRPVLRLSPQTQLLYIAASWFNDLTFCPPHPSFLASLFDAVYLTTRFTDLLGGDRPYATIDNPFARASLLALLTYLPRFGLRAPSLQQIDALRRGHSIVGTVELCMIHAMLDRFQIGAREWSLPMPPPVPGRYSVMHQLHKKLWVRLRK
ncbi:MAG: nucleotidyltransferase family protein [Burkholderiaceae bacterium]